MLRQIAKSISNRLTAEAVNGDVERLVNFTLAPLVMTIRNVLNEFAAELNGVSIYGGTEDPSVVPHDGEDGDLYVRKNGTVGGQLWIRTGGTWRAIG